MSDLIDACDNQYEENQFKKVQTEIFKILKWNINYPGTVLSRKQYIELAQSAGKINIDNTWVQFGGPTETRGPSTTVVLVVPYYHLINSDN